MAKSSGKTRKGLTPKQEKFCRAYVETGNASEAYRRAYPSSKRWKPETVHKRASELLSNGVVLGRVRKLQEAATKRHEITLDRLTEDALRAQQIAEESGKAADMLRAVELLAKMHGLLVQKHEVTGKNGGPIRHVDVGQMSTTEKAVRLAAALREALRKIDAA